MNFSPASSSAPSNCFKNAFLKLSKTSRAAPTRPTTLRCSLFASAPLPLLLPRTSTPQIPLRRHLLPPLLRPLRQNRFLFRLHPRPLAKLECLRSEEHTSELQSQSNLVCRLLLEK